MPDHARRVLAYCSLALCALLVTACSGGGPAPRGENGARETQELLLPGADGMKLRVVLAGKGPLLLVPTPGWGASLELYESSMRPLEEQFTVAYVDTRGTGGSTRPGPILLWALDRFAADLDRVREGLGRQRCYVLGHGSGSLIALSYGLGHAQHCAGLILVSGTASRGPEWQKAMIERVIARGKREPAFVRRWQQVNAIAQDGPALDDAEARGRLFAVLPTMFADMAAFERNRDAFAGMRVSAEAQKLWESSSGRLDLRALLPDIVCPVLVINGAQDHIAAPVDAETLAQGLPNAESWIAANAGHFPWLEARAAFFARIKTWLAQRR